MTEDEMVIWQHQRDGHAFEQAPGVGDEQGSRGVSQRVGHHLANEQQLR